MKILILVENYPTLESRYPMAYVHSRVLDYLKLDNEFKIKVLSFTAKDEYEYEGVSVIPKTSYQPNWADMVISHAPNIKNHKKFISSHNLKNVLFFIHGHEVLSISKYYPKPYSFLRKEKIKRYLSMVYDFVKLPIMRRFFISSKSFHFIFVSNWMKEETFTSLQLKDNINYSVIYNPINHIFVKNSYSLINDDYEYDFITVRPFDGSKYCIDQVIALAKSHQDKKFLLVGTGRFFNHFDKPKNVKIINEFLTPETLCMYMDKARCALMPTKLDAQGVMMCEMASYGIPIITSNITIAREVLEGYKGAFFIEHDETFLNSSILNEIESLHGSNISSLKSKDILRSRFGLDETTKKEIHLFKSLK